MTEDEKDIENTYKVITSIVTVIGIVVSLGITIYYTASARFSEVNSVILFLFIMIMIILSQQIQVCYTWLNRKGEYDVLMKNPIIQHGTYGIIAILLGMLGFKTYGYFIGHVAGLLVTLAHMKRYLPAALMSTDFSEVKSVILRNRRFVKYQMPTNILANFKNQLPILLIQGLWGTEIVGYYSITVKLLQVPSTLLANAIGRVFFQVTSSMTREGKEIGQYVYLNLVKAMKIGIIPMVILMAFGDIITVVFLGSEWKIAGDFARILALQYFFMFLMTTIRGLSIILGKQNYAMISLMAQIVGFLAGAYIGRYVLDSIQLGLMFMAISFVLINLIYLSALLKVMNVSRRVYISRALFSIFVIVTSSVIIRSIFNRLVVIVAP